MQDIYNFLSSSNGIALIVALIIFFVTIVLVIRRLIGFVITLILLIFAILSGLAIANNDIVRDIFQGLKSDSTPKDRESVSLLNQQVMKTYEDIKKEFILQRDEFKKVIEQIRAKDKEVEPKKEEIKKEETSNLKNPT